MIGGLIFEPEDMREMVPTIFAVLHKSWMVSPVLSSGHVAISRPYCSISRRWQSLVEGCESAAYGVL
jgi:hypothetical protein